MNQNKQANKQIKCIQCKAQAFYFQGFSLIDVRINKMGVVRGGGRSKARFNGQRKMNFCQGKVSEKSGKFISD